MGYSAAVLERVRDPKFAGWLPRDAPDVGTGEAGTAARGTVTRIQLRIDRATGTIGEAVFKVDGAGDAIACASLVAERLSGATIGEARKLQALAIVAELSLPLQQANMASLAVEAARHAIEDWERKQ